MSSTGWIMEDCIVKNTDFPIVRPRRLRATKAMRNFFQENHVSVSDLVFPLFIKAGKNIKNPIGSMSGHFQFSVDQLEKEIAEIISLKIPAVILFGIPDKKDAMGSRACDDDNVIQESIRLIKKIAPELLVISDLCYCEYTDHGHCGVIKNNDVDNDATLELLAKQALSHAKAGADMVAPSDMMDGRVGAIRKALDESGFQNMPIMSYAVKYASAFYGPFREAAESTPQFGDRRSYQMDPANSDEAIREVRLDIEEGADIVMVKPALPYLDIIRRIK